MSTEPIEILRSPLERIPIPINGTVVLFLVLLGIWETVASFYGASSFPSTLEVFDAMGRMVDGSENLVFQDHVSATLFRIVVAALISLGVGIPIGILMGSNDAFEGVFTFYLLVILTVPSVMWAFLSITWFGLTTHLVPIFATVMALLPYVIINIWKGTESVDSNLLEMGSVFGAGTASVWRNVYLPHLMPFIFSTGRMVLSLSWRIIIVTELFGTQTGIGFAINNYYIVQQNDMLLAWALPVFLLIFAFERFVQRVEKRKFAWREQGDDSPAVGV